MKLTSINFSYIHLKQPTGLLYPGLLSNTCGFGWHVEIYSWWFRFYECSYTAQRILYTKSSQVSFIAILH